MGRARLSVALFVAAVPCGALAAPSAGCSSSHEIPVAVAGPNGQPDARAAFSDGSAADDSSAAGDSAVNEGDGGADVEASAPVVVALAIVSADGRPLQGAPGDALPLAVALTMSDGVTVTASDDQVIWLTPITLAAKDPYDAGADIVPEAGVQPTAFFVRNDYRQTNPGVLYVVDQGEVANPTIVVTASVPDAGEVSAVVSILPALVGDAASGEALFLHGPECGICHGSTGGGSLPALLPDGGPELIDGGPAYAISGQLYSYPAPGLNNAPDSGNLASDPAWNAALLGMAAQSDMDNRGVALRTPMPDWFGGTNASGGTLSGQDFADIYAWLKTQTQ